MAFINYSSTKILNTLQLQTSAHEHSITISLKNSPAPKLSSNCSVNGNIIAAGGVSFKWRTKVSFFKGFFTRGDEELKRVLKDELFEAIEPLHRGANVKLEEQDYVDKRKIDRSNKQKCEEGALHILFDPIVRKLEAVNEVKEPLKSNLLNGKWELLYTTSQSLLQTNRPKFLRPNGSIYQAINIDTLRAQNIETWPFFNQATADLVPLSTRKVAVKFDYFKIFGLISIKNPGSGRGQIEITYVDEELRITRGNRGNLFILKMVDPSYRVPL
ncbi:hypothetical protein ACFE04_022053 [Oxalis oulophora]